MSKLEPRKQEYHPAEPPGGGGLGGGDRNGTRTAAKCLGERGYALQLLSIRLFLRGLVPPLLAAAPPGAKCPAAGGRLFLLRLLEPQVPRTAGPVDGDG